MARIPVPTYLFGTIALFIPAATKARSQTVPNRSVEVAITYSAQRSLELNANQNFWSQGGSLEFGVNAFRGFGIAAEIAGVHTSSIGSTGTPLSLVTETFGPRYRWHDGHRLSAYGEGLFGEADAFRGLFPSVFGAQSDANSLAVRVGGGIDLRLGHHLTTRAIDAGWMRTQLPNSGSNTQNNLLLGAGLVFRVGQ